MTSCPVRLRCRRYRNTVNLFLTQSRAMSPQSATTRSTIISRHERSVNTNSEHHMPKGDQVAVADRCFPRISVGAHAGSESSTVKHGEA